MSYTIARYALWALLCIPIVVLGFSLTGNLLEDVLQQTLEKKAKRDVKQAKEQKRRDFEDEYRRSRES